jgi:hypothetical protein
LSTSTRTVPAPFFSGNPLGTEDETQVSRARRFEPGGTGSAYGSVRGARD